MTDLTLFAGNTAPAELAAPIAMAGAHTLAPSTRAVEAAGDGVAPRRQANGPGAATVSPPTPSASAGGDVVASPTQSAQPAADTVASPARCNGADRGLGYPPSPSDSAGSGHGSVRGLDDAPGSGSPAGDPAGSSKVGDLAGRVLVSLDVLVAALRALAGAQVEERLRLVGRCESRLAAVKAEAVTELSRWRGEARAADVLRNDLKQSRGGAKREVKLAGQLAEVPATSKALATGAITPQHARLIAEAAEQAPADRPIDEAELLAAAEREPADLFGRTVRDHLNERSGDDLEERRRRQRERRQATIKQDPNGMYKLFGTFDPVTGARIETALTAAANRLWHGTDDKNRPTPKQRLADALVSLITSGTGNVNSAPQGVDLLLIADYDVVAGRLRDARLGDGTPLTPEELIRLACDAKILPALFDRKGQPLWLGRGRRHATSGQRSVLTERDKGCVGCGASANWCQAHHIVHWEHGGPTDIDNLCLLCSHCHHHQVHTNGAKIIRGPDGKFTVQNAAVRPPDRQRRDRERPSSANRNPSNKRNDIHHPIRC